MIRVLKYVGAILIYASAISSLIISAYWYYGSISPETKVFLWLFLLLALFLIIDNVFLRYKWWRKQLYVNAFEDINKGFSKIHELSRFEDPSTEVIKNYLRQLCNHVSKAFSIVTGEKCGVCIKILGRNENGDLIVETLTRDYDSSYRTIDDGISHEVSKNTDFEHIWDNLGTPQQRYFFKNYLPFLRNYHNTRFEQTGIQEPQTLIDSLFKWPLKYRSTIVVPICPGLNVATEKSSVAGFLCLDCEKFWSFQKVPDLDIMLGIADGLHNVIVEIYNTVTTDMKVSTHMVKSEDLENKDD